MEQQSALQLMRQSIRKKCAQIRSHIDEKEQAVNAKVALRNSLKIAAKNG